MDNIKIERKDIKKVRLKVYPNGTVKISLPFCVTDEWISDYLKKKTPWIEKTLQCFSEAKANEIETSIRSGVSTRLLGRQMRIIVSEGAVSKIEQKGSQIFILSPASEDQAILQKQFQRWWQKQSKTYFLTVIDKFYPVVEKHGIVKPALQVRKMKTLWGSSSKKHHKINLNYYLYKAPPPCIDYVVLHELAHFIYPKHNKEFYEFLTVYMPDWKERKRILDYEIVRGVGY